MSFSRLGGIVSIQFGSEDCLNHLHSESVGWELSLHRTDIPRVLIQWAASTRETTILYPDSLESEVQPMSSSV